MIIIGIDDDHCMGSAFGIERPYPSSCRTTLPLRRGVAGSASAGATLIIRQGTISSREVEDPSPNDSSKNNPFLGFMFLTQSSSTNLVLVTTKQFCYRSDC